MANRALLGADLEVGDVMVFKATNTESRGRKAKFIAFWARPAKAVDEDYPAKRCAAASSSTSSTDSGSSLPEKKHKATPAAPPSVSSSLPSSGTASESAYELRVPLPSKKNASQDYLY